MIGLRIACHLPTVTEPLGLVVPALSDRQAPIEWSLPGWLGTGYRGNTNMWPRRFGEPTLSGDGPAPARSIERGVELMRAASDDESNADTGDADAAPGARVRVHPGTDAESLGVIIEDFGEMPDLDGHVGDNQVANPPRRWAVALDDDTLVFVRNDHVTAINGLPLRTAVDECAAVNEEAR
jgi:hypothetical protein